MLDKCPFCAKSDLTRFDVSADDATGAKFQIVECVHCEVAWQWPRIPSPPRSIVEEYYNQYSNEDSGRERSALQLALLEKITCLSGRKILDVGAGNGFFIRYAADHGWAATGIDPLAPAFSDGDVTLLNCNLRDFGTGDKFDCVTMFDVVEHVPEYLDLIREASLLLRQGGALIIETGNYQSLSRIRGGKTWWDYQTNHFWYLSPEIVMRQLRNLGFQNISICDRVLRSHWRLEKEKPPSKTDTAISILKRPWRATHISRTHNIEREHAARWPGWYMLPIFTVIARTESTR